MSDLKKQIEISADATGVETGVNQAKRSLSTLGQAASDAGKSASTGLGQMGTAADNSAKSIDRATKSIVSQIQRAQIDLATAGKSMSESLQIKADFKGIDPAVIAPYIAQLKAAEQAQEAMDKSMGNIGMSAKATAAAMRNVPAQFTDIITSLQGGQKPMTVLLQQGGQLKDMFGGVGGAVSALGTYIGGLVANPIVLITAAVAGLAYASYSASQDAKTLRDSLALTGGAAGLSAGQLQAMAEHVGLSAAALAEFAKSGSVAADVLEKYTQTAIRFERLGGTAVSDTVKAFEALKKGPVDASVALNEKTNYLTASLYAQIKALEEQGRHLDAVRVAQDAYNKAQSHVSDNIESSLGPVDRMWLSISQNAAEYLKSLKAMAGFSVPLPDQITAQKKVVADLQTKVDTPVSGTMMMGLEEADIRNAKTQLDIEKQRLFVMQSSASVLAGTTAERAKQIEQDKAGIEWKNQVDANRSNAAKRDIEIEAARNRGAAAGKSQPEIDHQVALVNQKYDTGASVAAVKQSEDAKLAIITRAQDQINTLRATGQLTEIGQIEATTEQTLKAIDVRRNALLAERAIVAGRQDSEKEVISLDTQIAALAQDRLTAQAEGQNKITQALYARKEAIRAVQTAEREEFDGAIAAQLKEWGDNYARISIEQQDQRVGLSESNQLLEKEVSLVGASDQLRSSELAKLKIALDLERQITKLKDTAFSSDEVRQDKIAEATKIASEKSAAVDTEITTRYWLDAVKQIQNSLTDGIISGIENGGVHGAITGFRDALVKEFENLVLRPTISAIISPLAQGITGAFGISQSGSPSDGINNVSTLSSLSNITTFLKGGGLVSSLGNGITSFANVFGSNAASAFGMGMSNPSIMAPAIEAYKQAATEAFAAGDTALASTYTTTAESLGSGAGAAGAIPVIGWIIAGMSASGGAYDAGYRATNPINALDPAPKVNDMTLQALGLSGKGAAMLSGSALESQLVQAIFGYTVDSTGGAVVANLSDRGASSVANRSDFTQTGGVFGGGTTHNSSWTDASPELTGYIDTSTKMGTAAIKAYAATIGLSGTAIDTFTKQITVDMTGLDPDKQKAAIDNAIGRFFDDMVTAAYGASITSLAKTGETSSATLARLATDLTTVNGDLNQLGGTLLPIGIKGATAAAGLVDAFGGLDKLQASVAGYYDAFYSTSEKAANNAASLNDAFAALGLSVPASRDAFRQLVAGIDLSTDSGQKLAASVLSLAPAFDAAANAAAAAQAQMASVIGDYASASEVRDFNVAQIQKALADGGVNLTADQISHATREDARALYLQLVAAGNKKGADAVLGQGKAFAAITTPAAPTPVNSVGSSSGGGGGVVANAALTAWQNATDAIVQTMKDLQDTLIGSGPDSFAKLQAQFAIEIAQANAGDLSAYQDLPNIAKSLQTANEASAKTAVDQALLTAYIVDSLGRVAGVAGYDTTAVKIPHFAGGGAHGGGWAMVGEQGPELAYMPPARIYTAADTRALVGGSNNADVVEAVGKVGDRLDRVETLLGLVLQADRVTSGAINQSANGGQPLYVKVLP